MQGGEHQVAGLGELDGVLHGVAIANLADENDVGGLAQRVAQRGQPGVGVNTHLAMRDHAALVHVHEFDRVLDSDDMTMGLFVAIADHRGQRGGLARSGSADDDDQAAL